MNKIYDVIVIGVGSMGSSTLNHLASRGVNVLGIEQFEIGNDKGSHSGQSRLVRKAYFEHTDYIPLLEKAYKGWLELEKLSGKQQYHPVGIAYFGDQENEIIRGVKYASKSFNIPLSNISSDFESLFDVPANYTRFLEKDAGYVFTTQSIQAYVNEAKKHHAHVLTGVTVERVDEQGELCNVYTDQGVYSSQKVVFTAGPYVENIIQIPNHKLEVTQQTLFWATPKLLELDLESSPCWVITDNNYEGLFYGFPLLDSPFRKGEKLYKIAHHKKGKAVSMQEDKRYTSKSELNIIEGIVNKYLHKYISEIKSVSRCFYTYSKDEHFILDFLPNTNKKMIIASGFSGHGFKFIPVVGEIIADMVIDRSSSLPIEFLSLQRFIDK